MRKLCIRVALVLIVILLGWLGMRAILGHKADVLLDPPKPYNDTSVAVKGVQPPVPVRLPAQTK